MMNQSRRSRLARRPFWLPAIPFYSIAVVVAGALFVSTLAVFGDERGSTWISASIVGASVLAAAILVREILVRNFQTSALAKQRRLERSVLSAVGAGRSEDDGYAKVTLAEHAKMLADLTRKSDAAKVLTRNAEGDREVFELCEKYLAMVNDELPRIGVGSPRLSAFAAGRRKAEELHKFHLVRWAELEVTSQMGRVGPEDDLSVKEARLATALQAIDRALGNYPDERDLVSTRQVLLEISANVRAAQLLNDSRELVDPGDREAAEQHLIEAIELLSPQTFESDETVAMRALLEAEKIRVFSMHHN